MMQSSVPESQLSRRVLARTFLVLLTGVAGAGKSTIARALLACLHAVYLDNNFIADAFFAEIRHGSEYLRIRPRLYKALYRITDENLRVGNSVILDAPHIRQARSQIWYSSMLSMTEEAGAKLLIIRCVAPEQVIKARLEARGEPRDKWKLEHWEAHLRSQPIAGHLPYPHLDLMTHRPVEQTVHESLQYIRAMVTSAD